MKTIKLISLIIVILLIGMQTCYGCPPTPPYVALTASSTFGVPSLTPILSGSNSTPGGGSSITKYEWDFEYYGTFTPDDDYSVTTTYTYSLPNGEFTHTYTAALRVTNNLGYQSIGTCKITVFKTAINNRFYVSCDNGSDNWDGLAWGGAFGTIQHAIQAAVAAGASASNPYEIWVAAAYMQRGTTYYGSFQLHEGIALYGGFTYGITDRNQRNMSQWDEIILDGGNNVYHVVIGADNCTLDGFTIRGGNADGSGNDAKSGGMYNYHVCPTIANCKFTNNSATIGGGMYNEQESQASPSPVISNCTFSGNIATSGSGGGMYNYTYARPTILGCAFSDNHASGNGGAICNLSGYSTTTAYTKLEDCHLTGNYAAGDGGAIYNGERPYSCETGICEDLGTVLQATNCTFENNKTTTSSTRGGAINNYNGSVTVTNCTFTGNGNLTGVVTGLTDYGGAVSSIGHISGQNAFGLTVTSCLFSNNKAHVLGGAINSDGGGIINRCGFFGNSAQSGGGLYHANDYYVEITIWNSVFSGNSATGSGTYGYGGGVFDNHTTETYCDGTLTNCTFSNNSATNGGGMCTWQNNNVTWLNCIFFGNTASSSNPQISIRPHGTSNTDWIRYCDIDPAGLTNYNGANNINLNPSFVDDNGTDNTYGTPDDNLRLLSTSPCKDTGDPYDYAGSIDYYGETRVLNGRVDIGAAEYKP